LQYHFEQYCLHLLTIGAVWRVDLAKAKDLEIPSYWGPTDHEFESGTKPSIPSSGQLQSDSGSSDHSDDGLEDNVLELFESFPVFSGPEQSIADEVYLDSNLLLGSPKKRRRGLEDM
jgi:hypothetical protein